MEKALSIKSKSQKKNFELRFPPAQVFTKTDLAKFLNSWDQKPHAVCKGNQKNFNDFTLGRTQGNGAPLPDELYFKRLVAKAILFRRIEKLVREESYEAYRANITAYTVAYISYKTMGRLDLDSIWSSQQISTKCVSYACIVAQQVNSVITSTNINVGEWTKKADCWEQIKDLDIKIPPPFADELLGDGHVAKPSGGSGTTADDVSPEQLEQIHACMNIPAETWLKIHAWGKKSKELKPWQIGIALTLSSYAAADWQQKPSLKQAKHGYAIVEMARKAKIIPRLLPGDSTAIN